MSETDYKKQIKQLKKEVSDLTVKISQTRSRAKYFRNKSMRAKKWSDSIQSAVNQSGRAKFIRNLTEKIYLGRNVTKIGCELCNPATSFNYGMDENCERCGGSGFVYVGIDKNNEETK